MASVTKRGNTWTVRYLTYDAYGKPGPYKRVSGFKTKEDAMAAARELERASDRGVDVHGDRMTCGELMEKWHASKIGKIEDTTLSKYSAQIDRLAAHPIYNTPIKNLQKSTLDILIQEIAAGDDKHPKISVATAVDYTDPLRFALRWAASEGMILSNPFINAELPKTPKRKQVILTDDDVDDLVQVCKDTNPTFLTPLYLALYGGLCREEAAGLVWGCFNKEGKSVRIQTAVTSMITGGIVKKDPKREARQRTVVLPAFVVDYIAKQRRTSDYICCSRTGEPYALGTYAHTVGRLIEYANRKRAQQHRPLIPDAGYHDLRHTHVAMCIAMGVPMKVISERLGHSSIKITMDIYGYLMPGMQEQVAAAFEQKHAPGE